MYMLHIPDHHCSSASSDDTEVVTDVHYNLIPAHIPVQRTDVHRTIASTSEYAHQIPSGHNDIRANVQHQKSVKSVQHESRTMNFAALRQSVNTKNVFLVSKYAESGSERRLLANDPGNFEQKSENQASYSSPHAASTSEQTA